MLQKILLAAALAAAALAVIFFAALAPALAAPPCLERGEMIDTLIAGFGEHLAEVREIEGVGLIEFHVSPEKGTWTAVVTNAEGVSCVLAVGDGIDPARP